MLAPKHKKGWLSPFVAAVFLVAALFFLQRFGRHPIENAVFTGLKRLAAAVPRRPDRSEIAALREENRRLQEELVRVHELEREIAFLRSALYEFGPWTPRKQMARILGSAPMRPHELLYVDQGSRSGIEPGDLALAGEKTLIGRVREVYENVSVVETVLSREQKIASRISRTGHEGLFVNSRGYPELTLLAADADIVPGDLAVTSGKDGLFLAGFLLGKVAEITKDEHAGVQSARIELPVDFGSLEIVVLAENPL